MLPPTTLVPQPDQLEHLPGSALVLTQPTYYYAGRPALDYPLLTKLLCSCVLAAAAAAPNEPQVESTEQMNVITMTSNKILW